MPAEGTTTVLSTIEPSTVEASQEPSAAESQEPQSDGHEGSEGVATDADEARPASPAKPDLSKRFDALARRESNARRIAREVEEQRAAFNAEREAFAKERDALKAEREAFEADPVAFALKAGRDPIDIVRRASSPETEEQKQIRQLQARLDAREKAEQEREAKAKESETEAQHYNVMRDFVSQITPEEYPNLTHLYPAQSIPKMVSALLNEPTQNGETLLEAFKAHHGRNPTDKEVRAELEHRASIRAKALFDGLKPRFEAGTQPQSPTPPPATTPEPPKAYGYRGASLSNQHAGKVESTNGGGRKLSLEEKRALNRKNLDSELLEVRQDE